jgi:hypothetical protein
MGLSLARVGAGADDFSQLLPFLVRTWLYASGVMFSIQTIGSLRHHPTITYLLQVNPAAVYIGLVRNAILQSQRIGWPGSKPYTRRIAPSTTPGRSPTWNTVPTATGRCR